jgi:predicted transcriptional regulator
VKKVLKIDKDIQKIKEKALKHEIRQWELAREIGEFPSLVSNLFRGRMNPQPSEIHRLNVGIERILERRRNEELV